MKENLELLITCEHVLDQLVPNGQLTIISIEERKDVSTRQRGSNIPCSSGGKTPTNTHKLQTGPCSNNERIDLSSIHPSFFQLQEPWQETLQSKPLNAVIIGTHAQFSPSL
jgi:hypothetical protein